jgi:hypothetical protein
MDMTNRITVYRFRNGAVPAVATQGGGVFDMRKEITRNAISQE